MTQARLTRAVVGLGGLANATDPLEPVADGSVRFTDPACGITEPREGHPGKRAYGDHHVFRHDPRTSETYPVVIDVEQPNRLGFSPEGLLFHVADPSTVRKPPGAGNAPVRVHDAQGGVRCKNGRVFARIDAGFPDGLSVDAGGNVWPSSEIGVNVFDPSGAVPGRTHVPELTGNLCFGVPDGEDLYIAASTGIYRIRSRPLDARAHRLTEGEA